jgi:hypothetical protein
LRQRQAEDIQAKGRERLEAQRLAHRPVTRRPAIRPSGHEYRRRGT